MNSAVEKMLQNYSVKKLDDSRNALKEIVQEIALLGLSRANFFEKAAFYGGTALRVLYGLPRFSEDLDFTLFKEDENFKLEPYFSSVKNELRAYGFETEVESVRKGTDRMVESAFIKTNTKINLLKITSLAKFATKVQTNERLQIKFEVDVFPAVKFQTEPKHLFQPVGCSVISLQEPDLFGGKLHALLYRQWKGRVKGRDFYDFAWYLSRKTPARLSYLEEKMKQGGVLSNSETLDESMLKVLIRNKLQNTDFEKAKSDVLPFLRDKRELEIWSLDYFLELTERLKGV